MKKIILSVCMLSLVFQSCTNDDDGSNEKNKTISVTTGIDITGVDVPSSYTFNRGGNTTVSFSGQTTRLGQVASIGSGLKSATSTLSTLNQNFKEGSGFEDASLNSSKNVRSKTASSLGLFSKGTTNNTDAIKLVFDGYISSYINDVQTPAAVNGTVATAGNAGVADGKRFVNGDGLEYNQAFLKALNGGLVVDQVSNHYFNRLDDDNFDSFNNFRTENDLETLVGDDNFTTMEHHWDEAYGYIYGVSADDDVLMQKYINRVEEDQDFKGTAQTLVDAFAIGRAAIVAKNYKVRDEAITVIRSEIGKVIGIRAVYYLQQGKTKLSDRVKAFHDFSEGYGFIYSLQFVSLDGVTPLFTQMEVNGFINDLEAGNGFWDVSESKLDEISNAIAAKFSFSVAQAATLEKA